MILKRRYHLHPPGVVYCIITILLGLGALNSQNNLLFGAFGLALGGLLISGVVSGAMLMGLRISRVGIEPAPVGERVIIRYEVTNKSRFYPIFAVRIGEHRALGASYRNNIVAHDSLIMHLAPRKSMRLASACPATNRGEFSLEAIRIITRFPFGIVRKSIIVPEHAMGLVHPRQVDSRRLNETVGSSMQGDDPSSGGRQGVEIDLISLREYVSGDSPKRIAWRASARTGELVTRDSQAVTPTRRWVVIDLTNSAGAMSSDEQCEIAIEFAAAAISRITAAGGAPGLLVPATGLRIAPTPTNRQGVRGAPRERAKERELLDELGRIDLRRCKPARLNLPARIGANASAIIIESATGAISSPRSAAQFQPEPRPKERAR